MALVRIPAETGFFFSPQRPDRLWGPKSNGGDFPGSKVAGA
jgi:hypothetical protein